MHKIKASFQRYTNKYLCLSDIFIFKIIFIKVENRPTQKYTMDSITNI